MLLIKEIGQKYSTGSKRNYKYGLFKCSVCNCEVEKIIKDGINAKYCSHNCYSKLRTGVKRGSKNKRILSKDYVYIYNPEHPHAIGTRKLYVAEHRIVMEKFLDRYLTNDEIVHHIDRNTLNNNIENLQLLTPSQHSKLHHKERGHLCKE